MPEDKDDHEDDVNGDGGDAHVGEELVDPVTGRVVHTARTLSPSDLEPLRDLPLGVGCFTQYVMYKKVRGPSGPQLLFRGPSGRLDFVLRS